MNKDIKKQNDFGADFQRYHFTNESWKITANEIKVEPSNLKSENRTLESIVSLEDPHFKISKNKKGKFSFEVLNNKPEVLNFLINTSRIHWQKELSIEKGRSNLTSPDLSPDENQEQIDHLVNKIYTIGYLLHEYKDESKAWAVYSMDCRLFDNGKGFGRHGKSLLFDQLIPFFKRKYYLNGMSSYFHSSRYTYSGLENGANYVLIDDARKDFDITNLYNCITSDWLVNIPGNSPYTIPFENSPKISILSNFRPKTINESANRKVLYTMFSDYYHESIEGIYKDRFTVIDDFGGPIFIEYWDEEETNTFINFMMQCLSFYLGCDEKINPPMKNLKR
mgnify:CR=1 FL=1